MIEQLNAELAELKNKKEAIIPKIDEINSKRKEELNKVNQKYDNMVLDINSEIDELEKKVNNDLINSFINAIMEEFDLKRSTSEYTISKKIREYKEYIKTIDQFPQELVNRLEKLIAGDPIENIAYDLENIQSKYIRD
jgi:molecular chaperone GrpE (heat shock protein)